MFPLDQRAVAPEKQELFRRLQAGAGPVYVLGRNKYAQQVARVWAVRAFIDDFTTEKVYLDRPVIRMADWPKDGIVVSCVMDTLPLTALDRLRSVGAREAIDYFALARLAPDVLAPVTFCAGSARDIRENGARYEWVYSLLADDVSRQHFAKVVQFRLNMDLEFMRGFRLALERQYFEDFLPRQEAEVFVDGGGYDGQTSLQLAAWNGAYRRIYYFEPVPAMMSVSRRALAGLRDVRFVQKGLFSRGARLRFNAEAGSASGLSAQGQSEIDVVRLDDEVRERVTFVKLDIEGTEYEALQGMREHIRAETPTMAICIYHDQRDFWRIPCQVLEMNDCYRIYVRHYSESVRETVMFFIPRTR